MATNQTHLKVPCLLHIFPDEVLLQVLKGSGLGLYPGGPVEGLLQEADEAIRFLGVVVAEVCRAGMGPAAGDGIGAIKFPLDGVVVSLPVVGHRQGETTQVIATLAQQVEPICHASLDQVVLSLFPGDVAKKVGQVVSAVCRVACHVFTPSEFQEVWREVPGDNRDGLATVRNPTLKGHWLSPPEPTPQGGT